MRRPILKGMPLPHSASNAEAPPVTPSEMSPATAYLATGAIARDTPMRSSSQHGSARANATAPMPVGPTPHERAEELDALGGEPGRRARLATAAAAHRERRIAKRLARRDHQALVEVHELTSRAAFSAIVSIVRDRGYAEDVHQQVYAEVWRRADQFDPQRGTLLSWVLTIARSRALDHVRRRSDQPTDADVLAHLGGAEEDAAYDAVLTRALIGEALARIPEQERELLRLRFWEGLSQSEIAQRTGQPLGTVKSRMLSGLRTVKLHLEAEGVA